MTQASQEPSFTLPESTPRSSKTEFIIGGLRVFIYGLDEIKNQSQAETELAVLYLAHGRTLDYHSTEIVAQEVLHRYRSEAREKKVDLIAVTLDLSNHGERKISERANQSWDGGNETHAQDMLSIVTVATHDFQLLIDYLPTYLPPHYTNFHNIMSGISLGGHTSWRVAQALGPTKIHGMAPLIGSPNHSALLVTRLGVGKPILASLAEDLISYSYDDLAVHLNETQKRRWPRALADLIQAGDRAAAEQFPAKIEILIQNGDSDPLVPDIYTAPWVQRAKEQGRGKLAYIVQPNTGHTVTKEMVANLADWLGRLFAA
ncbi:Alpha/Beta hydrolase protein [Aspergillus crustosus]